MFERETPPSMVERAKRVETTPRVHAGPAADCAKNPTGPPSSPSIPNCRQGRGSTTFHVKHEPSVLARHAPESRGDRPVTTRTRVAPWLRQGQKPPATDLHIEEPSQRFKTTDFPMRSHSPTAPPTAAPPLADARRRRPSTKYGAAVISWPTDGPPTPLVAPGLTTTSVAPRR